MKLAIHIQEGFNNFLSAKLRALLALLGILVGTASVVAMVSGGEFATNEALKQFKALGTDLLAVAINKASDADHAGGSMSALTVAEANQLRLVDASIQHVAPYVQLYNPIQFDGHALNGSVLGVTDQFAAVVHIESQMGRFISLWDNYSFYCVIGNRLYHDIKKLTFRDPIGLQIQVGKTIFTIIGVAKSWPENSFLYANVDNAVMIPIMTSLALSRYATINNIILQLTPESNIEQVKTHITNYFNETLDHKGYYFRSAKELISRMSKQSEILTIFLGLIGGVSLLVGGIGVMNIMLVSVIERRREIGIRMAVGASPRDIRSLFLVEAVMLALVGGMLGVVVGLFIAYTIALFSHWEFEWLWLPPVIGFSVSAATGVFFGFYPAYKASQLHPIEALRLE